MSREYNTIYTYTWDLHDEGIDRALDRIADAGLTNVSLAVSYHISTYFLPHNPKRKIYYGEDGAVYFRPDLTRYGRTKLRARVSHVVTGPDYLPAIVEGLRRRGLGFTAWIVYFYNHHMARTFPDCAKRDAFGNPYLAQLCPAHPDVREYVLALTDDVLANTHPDGVYIESLSYLRFDYGFMNPKVFAEIPPRLQFLMGLCFCPYCTEAASRAGLNGDGFRAEVAGFLERELAKVPDPADRRPADEAFFNTAFKGRLRAYLDARTETASSLFEAMVRKIRSHGDVRVETALLSKAGQVASGLDPARLLPLIDVVATGIPAQKAEIAPALKRHRAALAGHARLLGNIGPADMFPETLSAKIGGMREAGGDGFTFYNYGLVREQQLQWVGEALKGKKLNRRGRGGRREHREQ